MKSGIYTYGFIFSNRNHSSTIYGRLLLLKKFWKRPLFGREYSNNEKWSRKKHIRESFSLFWTLRSISDYFPEFSLSAGSLWAIKQYSGVTPHPSNSEPRINHPRDTVPQTSQSEISRALQRASSSGPDYIAILVYFPLLFFLVAIFCSLAYRRYVLNVLPASRESSELWVSGILRPLFVVVSDE